jgi:hypothetical protein
LTARFTIASSLRIANTLQRFIFSCDVLLSPAMSQEAASAAAAAAVAAVEADMCACADGQCAPVCGDEPRPEETSEEDEEEEQEKSSCSDEDDSDDDDDAEYVKEERITYYLLAFPICQSRRRQRLVRA